MKRLSGFYSNSILLPLIIFILCFSVSFLVFVQSIAEKNKILDQLEIRSHIQAELIGNRVSGIFTSIDFLLISLREMIEYSDFSDNGINNNFNNVFRQRLLAAPQLKELFLLDKSGSVILSTDNLNTDTALSVNKYLLQRHQTGLADFNIELLSVGDTQEVIISRRIDDSESNFSGVIGGVIGRDSLIEGFDNQEIQDIGNIVLFNNKGVVWKYWSANMNKMKTDNLEQILDIDPECFGNITGVSRDELIGGLKTMECGQTLIVFFQLYDYPLRISVSYNIDSVLYVWEREVIRNIVILIIIFALTTVGLLFYKKQIQIREEMRMNLLRNLENLVAERTKDLKSVNISLKKTVEDKEILLKEIHHRVTNNLAMITSLIDLESYEHENMDKMVLDGLKNKIDSIRFIHEKLYKTSNFISIDLEEYFRSICESIISSFTNKVIDLELTGNHNEVDTKTGVSIGLIVTELFTNAVKYGIKDKGTIKISCIKTPGRLEISMKNDGNTIPDDLDIFETSSLGMKIISFLVEQLNGRIELSKAPETAFILSFPY